MKITDWPSCERPREKLLRQGAESLADAELLAVFLRTGIKGLTAVDLGRKLINRFGSIGKFLNAEKAEILIEHGMGPSKYAQLIAVLELAKRAAEEELKQKDVFTDVDEVKCYVQQQMSGLRQEVFAVLFLDSQHQLLAFRKLFFGTINAAAVYPREIVKQALADNAAAVILVHNHPSGVAEPSQADINITNQIQQALSLIDIRVLDHFIVGHANSVSFAQRGLIQP